MWRAGTPIQFAADDTPQQLTSTVGLCKVVRLMQHWSNVQEIVFGQAGMTPAATPPLGVHGWLAAPIPGTFPFQDIYENDAPNGLNANLIYVAGSTGETLLWAYLEQ